MAEDTIIQTSTEELERQNADSRTNDRIRQLSEKVELTSKERDEKDRLLKESNDKIATLEKENTFSSGFSDMLGNYSAAKDHKDEIKAKVMSGYTVEDATLAVLGKAGKLGAVAVQQTTSTPAGGSAATAPQGGQKEAKDMSQVERRAELEKSLGFS